MGTTILKKLARLNEVTEPDAVYREEDPCQRPRNTKQIKNKKCCENKRKKLTI